MTRKRKKNSRQRGSHTHGYGSKKKNRGAGNRGGRGRAGSGKRGDAKKPSYWKEKRKKGFKSIQDSMEIINIQDLKKFDTVKINLKEEGYDKLLATGSADKKYDLAVEHASKSAIKKIEEAGGSVTLLKKAKSKKSVDSVSK